MESVSNNSNYSLLPNYRCDRVIDINVEELKRGGVTALALDLDSTLTHHGKHDIDEARVAFLQDSGFILIIATNRLNGIDDSIIKALKPSYAQHAEPNMRKPAASYYQKLSQESGLELSQICMVGDRLLTDVVGANKVGMKTIWVKNIGNDPWYTKLFAIRPIERFIVKILSS